MATPFILGLLLSHTCLNIMLKQLPDNWIHQGIIKEIPMIDLFIEKKYSCQKYIMIIIMIAMIIIQPLISCKQFAGKDITPYSQLAGYFLSPPDSVRPGVYWYFMDGNQDPEAMKTDLKAMHQVGLYKVLILEVDIGVPRGPVAFMSGQWQDNFAEAVRIADSLGLEIILGTGPGWSGAGGPWIEPHLSMQHIRASSTYVTGPSSFKGILPVPEPRTPSRFAGLSASLGKIRDEWYEDIALLAFPTPLFVDTIDMFSLKTLYETQPYTIWKDVPLFIHSMASYPEPQAQSIVNPLKVQDITSLMRPDGSIDWEVPEGDWILMRFVARSTGQTTRPAPLPGHGFETDKFNPEAFAFHFGQYHQKLLEKTGPGKPGRGWTGLHLDSWEMGSQNWSGNFRQEFINQRGYDPQPYFPVFYGFIVGSREITERFLWDWRKTAQELVFNNHAKVIRKFAHNHGMRYSNQPYDMNPAGDIELGSFADVISCEFWTAKNDAIYSCLEAASVAHTMGRPIVRAEAFTSPAREGYKHNPADLKNQTDWAFSMGINDIIFHTYQHQPLGKDGPKPGMAMGPYGVHWHRNQTFWHMVTPFHDYIARCGYMLQQGVTVADILYLTPEGVPHIFLPPDDALKGKGLIRERKGYGFDAVSPGILMSRAKAIDDRISFPGGSCYRILVLPSTETMTPELLIKIEKLIREGITVIGKPPRKSPSLVNYPDCDRKLDDLARKIWGDDPAPGQLTFRKYGKGTVIWGGGITPEPGGKCLYPGYEETTALLHEMGLIPGFGSAGHIRYHHRRSKDFDIFFVSNTTNSPVHVECTFRTDGCNPELWDPVTGLRKSLPEFIQMESSCIIPVGFDAFQSYFIVFERNNMSQSKTRDSMKSLQAVNFREMETVALLDGPYEVTFDPIWGGPEKPVVFDELVLWDRHPDEGIRYYSGEAVYRIGFDRPLHIADTCVLFLDLGEVHKIARVKLNSEDLGIVWTRPFRVNISGKLKPSGNIFEIRVVNTWVNRLVGDQQPENKGVRELTWKSGLLAGRSFAAGRYTFTTATHDYNQFSPLQESGLVGPLRIIRSKK